MSAIAPTAAEKRTSFHVGFVPILLQKSVISRRLRLPLVILSRQLSPAPLGAVA